jgi:hypothetical protein
MRFFITMAVFFGALLVLVAASPTDDSPISPKNIEGTLARYSAEAAAAPVWNGTTSDDMNEAELALQCGYIYRTDGGTDGMTIRPGWCRQASEGQIWTAMTNYACILCLGF